MQIDPCDEQFHQGYRCHVEAEHDVGFEDLPTGLAIPFVQRKHMPWNINGPDTQPKDPEEDRNVGFESRDGEEANLEQTEEGEKDPRSIAKQDGEGFNSHFFVIRAILFVSNPLASVAHDSLKHGGRTCEA